MPELFDQLEPQLTEERKKVDVAYHDFSVRELVRMLVDRELNIAPAYQRKYRWKSEVASIFIESIFLGLPIPPIFVATDTGYEWEVVDGLQRLSSLLLFCAPTREDLSLVGRGSHLKLEGLQKLSKLNGLRFADFPRELQLYFNRQPLKVISLTDKSNPDVRFDLFERLNAGAISLSPQEVRSCIFRGPFNDFLDRLAATEEFQVLLKLNDSATKDGTAEEEVLKFFAYKNNAPNFTGRVKEFLNDYMKSATKTFDYGGEEEVFRRAVEFVYEATGGMPFLRSGAQVTPTVQFEACLVGAAKIIERGDRPYVSDANWINDEELKEFSRGGANTRALLGNRIDRAITLFGG